MGELLTMNESFTERRPLFPGKACYPLSPPKTPDMNYKRINDFPHSVHDQLYVFFYLGRLSSASSVLLQTLISLATKEPSTISNRLSLNPENHSKISSKISLPKLRISYLNL